MGALDQVALLKRHRITADEYQRLGEVGVLGPDARVELIDGEVIDMPAMGSRHFAMVSRLDRLLQAAVGDRAVVAVQCSMRLSDYSEPQPDLGQYRPRADFYAGALPRPADTLLLIEAAASTARYDREIKLPLYARAGVRELWIVDLDAALLRVHREPKGDGYLQVSATPHPGRVGIAALPGVEIDLNGLFG
jgi:Uma2 family endonuclease